MLVLIVILQLLTLAAVAGFVAEIRRIQKAPPAVAAPTPEPAQPAPPPDPGPQVHATMQRNAAGEWEHDGRWVREGTEAWQLAFDAPLVALRAADGTIIEGKQ